MRQLYRRHRGNTDVIARQYARAERDGLVRRRSDVNHTPAEVYASALLLDGQRKSWIHETPKTVDPQAKLQAQIARLQARLAKMEP